MEFNVWKPNSKSHLSAAWCLLLTPRHQKFDWVFKCWVHFKILSERFSQTPEFGLNSEALIWTESGVNCAKRLKSCCDSVTTLIRALGGESTYSDLKPNTKWTSLPCDGWWWWCWEQKNKESCLMVTGREIKWGVVLSRHQSKHTKLDFQVEKLLFNIFDVYFHILFICCHAPVTENQTWLASGKYFGTSTSSKLKYKKRSCVKLEGGGITRTS